MSRLDVVFIALVLVEALNSTPSGLSEDPGGYRQQLEWVRSFFFGYALITHQERHAENVPDARLIALANGIVGTIATRLSPQQLAASGTWIRGTDRRGQRRLGERRSAAKAKATSVRSRSARTSASAAPSA